MNSGTKQNEKIETFAPAELIRMLRLALEEAGIIVPLSITPMRGVAELDGTDTERKDYGSLSCKCELIVPDSLADYVVEVVTHVLRDTRFAGFLSRLVIFEIDEHYRLGQDSLSELVNRRGPAWRSRRLSTRKNEC
jgi:hypothetical protein